MEYKAREKAIRDYNQGILEAEQRGRVEGKAEEKKEGIRILITDHKEEQIPKEKTIAKLQKHYGLSPDQAEKYYDCL